MIASRDAIVDLLKTTGLELNVCQSHEADQKMNALNVRFLTDKHTLSSPPSGIEELLVSLDLMYQGTTTLTAERQAIISCDTLLNALKAGVVKGTGTLLVWDANELYVKDIPQDSYVHKNLTLTFRYLG